MVYLAHDEDLSRLVAIRRLPPDPEEEASALAAVLTRAKAVASLDHPNISQIYDVTRAKDGRPVMIFAYHPGETLARRLERGPVDADEAVRIVSAAARGLAAAHRRGIAHGDVRPGNVLLTQDGVKLLDFALFGEEAARSPRSDVEALGALLRSVLAGDGPESSPYLGDRFSPAFRTGAEGVLIRALDETDTEAYLNASQLAADLEALGPSAEVSRPDDGDSAPKPSSKSSSKAERYLAAIMFADLVGYSALMQGDEELAYQVRSRYREALEQVVELHSGEIVQHYGDGSVTVFRSAVDGVRAAVALQRKMREQPAIPLRTGLHVGDVIRDWDGVYGDGVNVAARVEAASPPGGVLVTGRVVRELRNQRDLPTLRIGRAELKNIEEPVELFAISADGIHVPSTGEVRKRLEDAALLASRLRDGTDADAVPLRQRPTPAAPPPDTPARAPVSDVGSSGPASWRRVALWAAPAALVAAAVVWATRPGDGSVEVTGEPERSVAVLPLGAIGTEIDSLFTDGLHESILTQLSQIPELAVISRTSVLQYRTSPKTVPEIARELGVGAVLEGSVQRIGDQIRVHMQLIDAARDAHVWSDEYDRAYSVDAIFDIQSDIARNVARELRAELLPEGRANVSTQRTDDVQALEHYFRGNILFSNRYDRQKNDEAIGEYERAVALDPDYAQAHAALARARIWKYWQFGGSVTEKESARAALDRALGLAPDDVETRLAQGQYQYRGERDYQAALDHFQAVERALPNDAVSSLSLGAIYRRLGQWEEAAERFERAARLAPNDPVGIYTAATTYTLMGRFEEARRHAERLARFLPPEAPNGPLVARWELAVASGDTAEMAGIVAALPDRNSPLSRRFQAGLAFLRRDYPAVWQASAAAYLIPFQEQGTPVVSRLMAAHTAGDAARTAPLADSARAAVERQLQSYAGGEDATLASLHGELAIVYAILGQPVLARQHAESGVRVLSMDRDAYTGRFSAIRQMFVYLLAGDHDATLEELRRLASVPSDITPGVLRLDPRFDPLRGDPRFDALLSER